MFSANAGAMGSTENPFRSSSAAASRFQMPGHFRRHGTAEQVGGRSGPTPSATPPRSRNSSPRSGSRRSHAGEGNDEPPARRDQSASGRQRSRSAERDDDQSASGAAPEAPTSMPAEWGGRTLRLEREVQQNKQEILKLNALVAEMQTVMEQMNTKVGGDQTRLDSLESALPERVHRCEERQANHIEILNGFARHANEQISTIQHRINTMETAQSQMPTFGGGAVPGAQRFDIGSPISDVFQRQPPAAVPQTPPPTPAFDPWANARPSQQPMPSPQPMPQTPMAPMASHTFISKEWNVSDKKVLKALTLFDGQAQHYRNWSDRMKDHFKEVNTGYAQIF